jgi:hypothetical protein
LTWSEPHLLPKVSSDKSLDAHLFQKAALSPLPGTDETVIKQTRVNSKPHHHHKQDQTRERQHYINLATTKKKKKTISEYSIQRSNRK